MPKATVIGSAIYMRACLISEAWGVGADWLLNRHKCEDNDDENDDDNNDHDDSDDDDDDVVVDNDDQGWYEGLITICLSDLGPCDVWTTALQLCTGVRNMQLSQHLFLQYNTSSDQVWRQRQIVRADVCP